MPKAAEFLSGFGFIKGSTIDGYTLVAATSTHESIRQYQEYSYSIVLEFHNNGTGDYLQLFYAVINLVTQQHIIYGVRNPYLCSIDYPNYGDITEQPDGTITFHLIGHSHRTK